MKKFVRLFAYCCYQDTPVHSPEQTAKLNGKDNLSQDESGLSPVHLMPAEGVPVQVRSIVYIENGLNGVVNSDLSLDTPGTPCSSKLKARRAKKRLEASKPKLRNSKSASPTKKRPAVVSSKSLRPRRFTPPPLDAKPVKGILKKQSSRQLLVSRFGETCFKF